MDDIKDSELTAFGARLRAETAALAEPVQKDFLEEVTAGILLANPNMTPAHDVTLALGLLQIATNILFRAGYQVAKSDRDMRIAVEYIAAIAQAKIKREISASARHILMASVEVMMKKGGGR
jgi:hypothetical protein